MQAKANALALTYTSHGKPEDVLQPHSGTPITPEADEIRARMLAAAIHPSDLGMIQGVYGRLPDLPAVAGREGVAEVEDVGGEVSSEWIGKRILIPEGVGSWQTYCCCPAASCIEVSPDIPVEQAALARINPPTALRLLEDFACLQEGDWIIQNAANSAVGQCVIQISRMRGIHTLNVLRTPEKWEAELKELGADVVLGETSGYEKDIASITGGKKPSLGLNSVGGESVRRLIKSMGLGATVVTFGGMTGEPIRFPTRQLIFEDLKLCGFWMDRWYREADSQSIQDMMNRLFNWIHRHELHIKIDQSYALSDYREALERAQTSERRGKVLFHEQ